MKIPNKIMLITYADSLGGDLPRLHEALRFCGKDTVGSVHILPFFPSSGDRGFSPTRYDMVEPSFGSFADVERIGREYPLMFDLMINHLSSESLFFQNFLKKKDESPYRNFFLRYRDFWEGGEPTPEQVERIYKRKPRAPYVTVRFSDGSEEKVWCTFGEDQIDLNVQSSEVRKFFDETIEHFCRSGAAMIRLDAFAYAVKEAGGTCFFTEPGIWTLLEELAQTAKSYGAEILPEIHEHYRIQQRIAERGYYVYDFALPMLVLHALYTGRSDRLQHWFSICPRRQFTTLDTHDGIGVVDAADLLSPEELEETQNLLYEKGANVKRIYNTEAYRNLDVYQLNCTYYSALGNDDKAYLLARAIQFFAPGIPQVYYVGMLAGENDIELMERTKEGRSINRHNYTPEEIRQEAQRPVVRKLWKLMRLRNTCPAFDGSFESRTPSPSTLEIVREHQGCRATLYADLKSKEYQIKIEEATK